MSKKRTLTTYLNVRVTKQLKERFIKKSRDYGGAGEVLRELVEAWADNRVTLERDPERKSLENLYDE